MVMSTKLETLRRHSITCPSNSSPGVSNTIIELPTSPTTGNRGITPLGGNTGDPTAITEVSLSIFASVKTDSLSRF
jgi:hypothetical protein